MRKIRTAEVSRDRCRPEDTMQPRPRTQLANSHTGITTMRADWAKVYRKTPLKSVRMYCKFKPQSWLTQSA